MYSLDAGRISLAGTTICSTDLEWGPGCLARNCNVLLHSKQPQQLEEPKPFLNIQPVPGLQQLKACNDMCGQEQIEGTISI